MPYGILAAGRREKIENWNGRITIFYEVNVWNIIL